MMTLSELVVLLAQWEDTGKGDYEVQVPDFDTARAVYSEQPLADYVVDDAAKTILLTG